MPVKKGYKGDYKKVMTELKKQFTTFRNRRYHRLEDIGRCFQSGQADDCYNIPINSPVIEYKGEFCIRQDNFHMAWKDSEYTYKTRHRLYSQREHSHLRGILAERDTTAAVYKRFQDMMKYDSIDAFLSEHIKNSICEDNLGDILSFL